MRGRRTAEDRKIVQGLVILTILAWATQTLLSQWGFGAEGAERFVPPDAAMRPVTLELRGEATVVGSEVQLRQIARWSEADETTMNGAASLVIGRFQADQREFTLQMEDVRTVLEGAGVNTVALNFSGSMVCRVRRSDPPAADAAARPEPVAVAALPASARPTISTITPPASVDVASAFSSPAPAQASEAGTRSLREILLSELSERFARPAEDFQVRFRPQDEKWINLREPHCRFVVEPRWQRDIGDLTWDVTIAANGATQRVAVTAVVRAWQTQVVALRPIAQKQLLREEDLAERRVLVDRLGEGVPVTKEQAVGQQASRDLEAGMPVTGRMLEAVQLVRPGELMTVSVTVGTVQLSWIGQAREGGAKGQTVLVRKPESPREEYRVMVTGPQQGRLLGPAGGAGAGPRLAVVGG